MLILLSMLACDQSHKTFHYDISSTVLVLDETGVAVNAENIEICQQFRSEDYDTRTAWEVHAVQCDIVDIDDGIVLLPNWEGEYFGSDVDIAIEIHHLGEIHGAELISSDEEVWCDNGQAVEFDENGNVIEYQSLCEENYERYLVWSAVLPMPGGSSSGDTSSEDTSSGDTSSEDTSSGDTSSGDPSSEE